MSGDKSIDEICKESSGITEEGVEHIMNDPVRLSRMRINNVLFDRIKKEVKKQPDSALRVSLSEAMFIYFLKQLLIEEYQQHNLGDIKGLQNHAKLQIQLAMVRIMNFIHNFPDVDASVSFNRLAQKEFDEWHKKTLMSV